MSYLNKSKKELIEEIENLQKKMLMVADENDHSPKVVISKVADERYRNFFYDDLAGNFITSPSGKFIDCNKACLKIFGFQSIEEAREYNANDLYLDHSVRKKKIELLIKNKKLVEFEETMRKITGEKIVVLSNLMGEFDDDNNLIKIRGHLIDITKRKQAESELKISERRYTELVNIINSGVAVYEVLNDGQNAEDYIIKDFNKTAQQIEGLEKEDVIGKNIKQLRPGIDDFGLIPIFRKVWKTGNPAFYPAKIYEDGKFCAWYENRVFRLPDNEIVAVYDDVTDQKNAEAELARSEARFHMMFDNHNTIMLILEPDFGKIVDANPAAVKFYGYSHDILRKMFVEEISCLSQAESLAQRSKAKRKEQDSFLSKHKLKNNETRTVEIHSTPINFQNNVLLFCIIHDISERIKAEKALKESEERFKLAMQAATDGIFDWNLVTNTIYYSPGWKSILGYKDHEVKNEFSEWERLTNEEDVKKSWEMLNAYKNGEIDRFEMEFQMKHKNGRWVDVLSRANIIFDDKGKPVRMVGTHADITDRKKYEEELTKHRERLQELVKERTKELEKKNEELENYNKLFIGREFRIKELRDKIKELKSRLEQKSEVN